MYRGVNRSRRNGAARAKRATLVGPTCAGRLRVGLLLGGLLLLSMLSACKTAPQVIAAITGEEEDSATVESLPVTTATPEPLPPIVSSHEATPTSFPSFAPKPAGELVTPSPPPTEASEPSEPTATEDAAGEAVAGGTISDDNEEATAGPTEPPPPTFTPPATPDESSDDHYWLQRPVAAGGVVWTDKHYPYGSTRGGELRPHHGVEFNVPYNTEILAAAAGTVRVAGSDSEDTYGPHPDFYGNLVVVEHDYQYAGQSLFTLYGHLNEVSVSVGQQVAAQEVLGLSGATGVADGPHMHFEVRLGANTYESTRNPLLWLFPFPQNGTIAGRVVWPDGSLAAGAPVSLNRIDGSSPYYATTTYSSDSVNADEHWQENFVIDDVNSGYYEVVVRVDGERYTAETWVYDYRTSFVEIMLH